MKKLYLIFIVLFLAVYAYCGEFSFAVLNVGQGLNIVCQSPDGKTLIYDCGTSDYNNTDFEQNKFCFDRVTKPYLEKIGAKEIEYALLSHTNTDHYTGYLRALELYKINNFYHNGRGDKNRNYRLLSELVISKKINAKYIDEGFSFDLGKEVKCEVLAPMKNYNFRDHDENSIMMKITYNKISFLLTGDTGSEAEKYIVQKYGNRLKSNVLVCAGHGTKYATEDAFLSNVMPKYALISCGKNNPYHLPHLSLIKRLEKYGAEILRTDTKGSIVLTAKDGKITVKSQ